MERVRNYTPQDPEDLTIEILQAFDTYLPPDGRATLHQHLQSLHTDEDLFTHATSLLTGLLDPMRLIRSDPTLSCRAGIDDSINDVAAQSTESASRDSNLKANCLSRDNWRCLLTGGVERNSPQPRGNSEVCETNCAHIIPLSLARWKDEKERAAKNIVWLNLTRCFPGLIDRISFTRDCINDTRNALTINTTFHGCFDRFEIALEETPTPHTYRIVKHISNLQYGRSLPHTVTFRSSDAQYELPSPELLKIHAILARIIRMSGAAENIDKAQRDLEQTRVLAEDGSSDITRMLSITTLGVLSSENPTRAYNIPNAPNVCSENPENAAESHETNPPRGQENRAGKGVGPTTQPPFTLRERSSNLER